MCTLQRYIKPALDVADAVAAAAVIVAGPVSIGAGDSDRGDGGDGGSSTVQHYGYQGIADVITAASSSSSGDSGGGAETTFAVGPIMPLHGECAVGAPWW